MHNQPIVDAPPIVFQGEISLNCPQGDAKGDKRLEARHNAEVRKSGGNDLGLKNSILV